MRIRAVSGRMVRVLVLLAVMVSGRSSAQRTPPTRQLNLGPRLIPPTVSGFSSANARPGQTLQVLGTGLSYVTSVTFLSAERDWSVPGRYKATPNYDPIAVTYTPGGMSQLSVVMPAGTWATTPNNIRTFVSFLNGHPLLAVVAGASGVDTSDTPVLVDKTPLIIGVDKTKVPAGETVRITGLNLESVTAGYIGDGPPTTAINSPNPPLATLAYPMGNGAELTTDAGCNREGYLQLATSYSLAPLVGSNIRITCATKPQVTSVVPGVGAAGTVVQLLGKGFAAVTAVVGNGTSGWPQTYSWSRVSDSELRLTLPSVPGIDGVTELLVNLQSSVYSLIFPAATNPVLVMPPVITGLSQGWGEHGSLIAVYGRGLADPKVPARFSSEVRLGGVNALYYSFAGQGQIDPNSTVTRYVTIPNNAPVTEPRLVVRHLGGTATWPFIFVDGPSEVRGSPVEGFRPGSVLTLVGHNLARVGAVCFSGSPPPGNVVQVPRIGDPRYPTTNDTVSVVVPQWAASGSIGLYTVPVMIPATQYGTCQWLKVSIKVGP